MTSRPDPGEWSGYFRATADLPPHALFERLDPYLPPSGDAIDLGCGPGRGTRRLLERGLRVTAVDVSEEALAMLRERVPADAPLTVVHASFPDLALERYDVAVACYTLFFLTPDEHAAFWPKLVDAIEPGGIFAGEFLGPKDDWVERGYAIHDREAVGRLLEPFDVLELVEDDLDGTTATGDAKHWHVFHAIARKR